MFYCTLITGHFLLALPAIPSQPLLVTQKNMPLRIRSDQSLRLEVYHYLVDALARGAHQVGDVALGQRDRDADFPVRGGATVTLGKGQQLARHPPVYVQCG